jgi:2-polyprenyl-3-methyl-5-hydroxy-6-metoxy-1,4-benzoquinol methylase
MSTAVETLAAEWTRLMAPRTGDVRRELVEEAAEFLHLPIDDAWRRLEGAREQFRDEWRRLVPDATDQAALTRFYNESESELFELIDWHARDPIHYRTLIVRDLALRRPGRCCLDYGSGIGSDAIVAAAAGFDVTLADVSDGLLAFAAFRCRRRGFTVRTIDLKQESLPERRFDLAFCLDVLEHLAKPLKAVRALRSALADDGLLVIHAPFGTDLERPMHVIHSDLVTPRMRSLGFQPVPGDFPPAVRAPRIYEKCTRPLVERAGYFVYDGVLDNALGARIAAWYRRCRVRSATVGAGARARVIERGRL